MAAGLATIAPEAGAIVLGDPEVRSGLGENLDLRIPVTVGRGESIAPSCFSLARVDGAEIPRLGEAVISLERSAQGTRLRLRSGTPMTDPSLQLGIMASCPGQTSEYRRDYSILLEARPAARAPAPVAASAPLSIAATLIARIGDTLASIANAIFPRNRTAKKTYIDALREANPPLAALADNDPIPIDAPIALPDLRTFARGRPTAATQLASAAVPTEAAPAREPAASRQAAPRRPERREPKVAAAPRERTPAPAAAPRAREERRAVATAPAPAPPPARTVRERSPGFQLKLSSGEVDLTRSRAMDDRSRARLRDRQLVLDVDDQVAAVLALRNSVKQLESRVAELQLKLAGMPASLAAARVEPPAPAKATQPPRPAPIEAPKPAPIEPPKVVAAPKVAPVEPPKVAPVEPPKVVAVDPPKVAPVPAPKAAVETRVPEPAPKASPAPPPAATTVPSPAKPAPPAAAKVAIAPADTAGEESWWRTYGLWALLALVLVALLLLLWGLARRRRHSVEADEDALPESVEADEDALPEDVPLVIAEEPERREPVLTEASIPAELERRAMVSDASLATRLPDKGGADELRRRYIEERFPEIVNRTIVLDDPDSVIKGARLFYEDGAVARAVELLQFAVERNPAEIKTWLALFEIFRLERVSGEFAQLATRFKQHHGKSDYWRKVQFFGREIDPGNELYRDENFKGFETIGPAEARRRAAEEANVDPIAENWLKAPMDFENEVLANELRKALMAQAGINERDLVPNPMPALRNVEMFTVA